jgi:nicotinamidase-related amidase
VRSHTALLLIDFINPMEFEEADALAPRALRAAECTARLKERAKAAGICCIYANDNFGNWRSEFSALARECAGRGGAPGTIATTLRPGPDDLSVLKPRHSAFFGTPLDFLLEELEVSRLIMTGLTADMCVFATAQDAYVRQFELWVPEDCVAAFHADYERSSLAHMARTMKADTRAGTAVQHLA